MEQFDLQKEIDLQISQFATAVSNGTVSILEWFYNALNIKMIFENESIANVLYNRLKNNGYEEINNPIEELECFKRLMKRENDDSSERIGKIIISLIMNKLREYSKLEPPLVQFIEIYNETYNQERTYANMMNNLMAAKGESITFVVIIQNQIKLLNGILENVEPYKSIMVNQETYPFIGYQSAISKITSNFGNILYNNSHIALNDKLIDANDINKKAEETFGTSGLH